MAGPVSLLRALPPPSYLSQSGPVSVPPALPGVPFVKRSLPGPASSSSSNPPAPTQYGPERAWAPQPDLGFAVLLPSPSRSLRAILRALLSPSVLGCCFLVGIVGSIASAW